MGATSKSSAHEVPGWRGQRLLGKMKSFTERDRSAKHVASSSANNEDQGSQSGRGVTRNCSKAKVDEGSSSHCKEKIYSLHSWRESLKCSMGTLEDANQKIKVEKLVRSSVPRTGSCGRNIPMDNVVIIDDEDDDTGTSTCDVSSDNEQDDHDSCIEINSGNVISDTELDGDDESIESDSSSNESTSSLSKQTVEQNPNAWPPSSQSTDLSDDDDDCQVVFEYGSQPPFTSMGGTQIHHKQSSSGYYRNVQDLNTDSSDCEILEATHGEIRQKWEEAALRKRSAQGLKHMQHEVEVEPSVSGSNLGTNSPYRGDGPEFTTIWQDDHFEYVNVGQKLRNPSDFESEITMNDTSYPINVTMHRMSKSLDKENPSKSGVCTSVGAVPLHEGTVELDHCRDTNKLDGSGKKDRTKEPLPDIACHQCPEEENLHFFGTSKGVSSESGVTESLRELIGDREKLKETSEFKRADEEEWTRRQLELQQQAKEVQQLRMRKRAEAERVLEMERRQKRRLEEIWATQKKEEQTMDLKEQFRGEITSELEEIASNCKDMASLLRRLGIPVGGGSFPSSQQVNAAYKQALLRFHPDRASKAGLQRQVEAEETFKLISRLKDTLPLSATTFLNRTYW